MDTRVELPLIDLPVIDETSRERADAVRNRARILAAAERLFGERGVGCTSMDDVAAAAGVGKGTVFRRFGSRAALARAVLDERERALQEHFIRGAAPLGPGAPPQERLIAFGEAMLEMLEDHAELMVAADSGGARFVSAPYGVHRLHVMLLLREADTGCDAEVLAETLLAALSADLFVYLRHIREMSLQRVQAGWAELVRRSVPTEALTT
jgi:AcrR family transcriptional regulator